MPAQKEKTGKREHSLGTRIDPNGEERDAGKRAAVNEDSALQMVKSIVDTVQQKNEVAGQQKDEDSTSGPQVEVNLADEIEAAQVVLLCISGTLEGLPVKYLIDGGASDCFVSNEFVAAHGLKTTKTKEKLKIHLADGSVRVTTDCIRQVCVSFGEHTEFLDL